MAKIIPLEGFRFNHLLEQGSRRWHQHYKENLDARSPLNRLNPSTLWRLAQPEDESGAVLRSLVIGYLGYKISNGFESLEPKSQCRVLDIQMFMADQVRFEIMYRLGWLERFEGGHFTLIEMVMRFEEIRKICLAAPPRLAPDQPGYSDYHALVERDQQVFIRRLLPAVLELFKHINGL